MHKTTSELEQFEDSGPQTFEEALEFALRSLAEPAAAPIAPEWLAALDREKESSSR